MVGGIIDACTWSTSLLCLKMFYGKTCTCSHRFINSVYNPDTASPNMPEATVT